MATMPVLLVVSGPDAGLVVPLRGRLTIGREGTDVVLSDVRVSRLHATLTIVGERVEVADAGSTGGTRLDGAAVTTPVPLPPGGRLTIGQSELTLLRPVRTPATAESVLEVREGAASIAAVPILGTMVLGRAATSDITMAHGGFSRRHAEFTRDGDVVYVRDLESSNGTLLNGSKVGSSPKVLRPGDELEFPTTGVTASLTEPGQASSAGEFRVRDRMGRDRAVRLIARPDATIGQVAAAAATYLGVPSRRWTLARGAHLLHPDDLWHHAAVARGDRLCLADALDTGDPVAVTVRDGVVTRTPASPYRLEPHRIEVPRPPSSAPLSGRGLGWQLGAGALGLGTGIVIGAATGNWLFALLGGAAGVGAAVFGILGERSRRAGDLRRFRQRVAAEESDAAGAVVAQAAAAWRRAPAYDDWLTHARLPGPPLWERRPGDADFGRLTLGTGTRPFFMEQAGAWTDGDDEQADALVRDLLAHRMLTDVPVLAPASGVLALAGPRRTVAGVVRSMVVEAALRHAPSDLALVVVTDAADGAEARWLPHADDPAGGPWVSHDTESARSLVERLYTRTDGRHVIAVLAPGLTVDTRALVASWTAADGLLIICVDDAAGVPASVTQVVAIDAEAATLSGVVSVSDPLAPQGSFRPVTLEAGHAEQIVLALAGRVDPAARGARRAAGEALLELLEIDLDDPGALEAEWALPRAGSLRAVIGRDREGDPVELDFDTDGPHAMVAGTTGSGKSEVLATLLTALVAQYSPEDVALFLVDFKGGATMALFADAPHVVGIVTDIESDARLGMRAFTALDAEIARRKRLLSSARAGSIGDYRAAGAPGGALPSLIVVIDEFALLVNMYPAAKERLDTVATQGRSLGVHLVLATQNPGGVVTPKIRANTNLWLALRVVSDAESREIIGMPDAARLPLGAPGRGYIRRGGEMSLREVQVARVTVPVDRADATRLEPFADDRPDVARSAPALARTELDAVVVAAAEATAAGGYLRPAPLWHPPLAEMIRASEVPDAAPERGLWALLGIADDQDAQTQLPYRIDLSEGNLLVIGGPGTGRSAALRQVACSLAQGHDPQKLHLYALTVTASLADLAHLPHTGAVVGADDREMLVRLLARLTVELKQRQQGSSAGRPRIVLLIDDYVLVKERLEADAASMLGDALGSIMLGGRSVGMHTVLATYAQTDLRMATLGVFAHRAVLSTLDRSDYLAIDWRPDAEAIPPAMPGRAMVAGPRELQFLFAEPVTQAAAGHGGPDRLRRLPLEIDRDMVAGARTPHADVLGLGSADVTPVLVRTEPGAHLLVLGAGGTGRSTALATIASAALDRLGARVVIIAQRRGPLDALRGRAGVVAFAETSEAIEDVWGAAQQADLIVIDDAELLTSTAGDRLDRMLAPDAQRAVRVAVAMRPADWGRAYESWTRQIAASRLVLVLSDFRDQAARLDVKLPPAMSPSAPGRGYLIDSGTITEVQVARSASGSGT